MKNEALKKNLFWILTGAGTFFALLAVLFVLTGAGGAIETKTKEIQAKRDEASKTSPKGTQAEKDYIEQNAVYFKKS